MIAGWLIVFGGWLVACGVLLFVWHHVCERTEAADEAAYAVEPEPPAVHVEAEGNPFAVGLRLVEDDSKARHHHPTNRKPE